RRRLHRGRLLVSVGASLAPLGDSPRASSTGRPEPSRCRRAEGPERALGGVRKDAPVTSLSSFLEECSWSCSNPRRLRLGACASRRGWTCDLSPEYCSCWSRC